LPVDVEGHDFFPNAERMMNVADRILDRLMPILDRALLAKPVNGTRTTAAPTSEPIAANMDVNDDLMQAIARFKEESPERFAQTAEYLMSTYGPKAQA